MQSQRATSWAFTAATLALALAVNEVALVSSGFDLSSFAVFFLVPVGAIGLCFLASSGFYLCSKIAPFQPSQVDLLFLMLVNLGLVVLVYVVEYYDPSFSRTAGQQHASSLSQFVVRGITESKVYMQMRGMPSKAPPVAAQEAGWLFLLIRVAAALAVAKIVHSRFDKRSKDKWAK